MAKNLTMEELLAVVNIIYRLLESDRHYKMDDEDFEVLKSGGYL